MGYEKRKDDWVNTTDYIDQADVDAWETAIYELKHVSEDIREYGADTASSDNSGAFQDAIDATEAAGGGILQIPVGTWNLTGTITLPHFAGGSVILKGQGRENSILKWTTDLGSGEYAIDADTGFPPQGRPGVLDLSVEGPAAFGTIGTQPTLMHGIKLGPAWDVRNCWISDFNAGIVRVGNHATVYDCRIGGCYYGIYHGPDPISTGGNQFCNIILSPMSTACMAVANDNYSGGDNYDNVHFGQTPYGIFVESGGGGSLALGGCVFTCCQFEALGNAAIYDIDMGRQFINNSFVGCGGANMFASDRMIAAHDQDYVFKVGTWGSNRMHFNDGSFVPGDLGIFQVGVAMGDNHWTYPRTELLALSGSLTAVEGTISGNVLVEYNGLVCQILRLFSTACSQYDLLSNTGLGVATVSATRMGIGVAQHAADADDKVVMAVSGVTFINATGAISEGTMVKRDTANAGTVVAATGAAGEDIIGIAAATASGGMVRTRLRGLR